MTILTQIPQPALRAGSTPDYDSETAALLRCALRPLFEQAQSWDMLSRGMLQRGYRMSFRNGRLCLIREADGARICGLRFLGLELRDLVARLGRPVVRASRGSHADGELLATATLPRPALH